MKYLITGCCGFLGTNLSKKLLESGHQVIGYDNFITGTKQNLSLLNSYNNFSFEEKDICDLSDIEIVDYVFNLACPASPKHYMIYPLRTIRSCTIGVENLLKYCYENKINMFHSSTSEVYGDPLISPQHEDYNGHVNSYGPRSCYDCGKQLSETLCYEYAKKGVKVHLARIFNSYGEYMCAEDGRVVSEFINRAINDQDLIIYGDGNTTRSFCYVDDTVNAFIKFSHTEAFNTPINIGNPIEFTLNSLAELVIEKCQSKSRIIYEPAKQDDPKQRRPDITKAKRMLDWEPKISLSEGLEKAISYFKQNSLRNIS
jgi:UDP-glucuronate decarboxylase